MIRKRGQTTIFIIAGIVILILVILFFAGRKGGVGFLQLGQEDLQSEMDRIHEKVVDCMAASAEGPLERLGKQGGYLSTPEKSYRFYSDTPISYLCWRQSGKPTCTNRLLTVANMEEQLEEVITEELKKCLNVKAFVGPFAGYSVDIGNSYTVDVLIKPLNVIIDLNYPITLKGKEGAEVSEKKFEAVVNVPLGQLYDVVQDILNFETQFGEFDQLMYMLQKKGQFMIYKRRPYPDKLYILKRSDNPYIFQFSVQGEPL